MAGGVRIKYSRFRVPCQAFSHFVTLALLINQPLDSGAVWGNNGISSPPPTMVLNIASDLKTRQLVWVRNGIVKTSVEWAALGRQNRL